MSKGKPQPRKSRMAPYPDAPPGLEQDGKGDVIPLSQRTKDDRDKARQDKARSARE